MEDLLRIVADDYERAQKARIAKGEQIRAIAQGRDEREGGKYLERLGYLPVSRNGKEVETAADALLNAILKAETDEPMPYMASSYRLAHRAERLAFSAMKPALESHPAWEWMGAVRGVGPTLAAKLLARLDIDKARNGSSFHAYCGLATVPGQRWKCSACGWVGIFPATYAVTGKHKSCKTLAAKVSDHEDGVRAAQPKSAAGEKATYDRYAKKVCYLLGSQFLKAGEASFYATEYRRKRAFYDAERPGWEDGRKHYSALRAAEKLFLSHLYEAWCIAIGREPVAPYPEMMGHQDIISAAEVLDWEEAKKQAA